MVKIAVAALEEKKGEDIKVIDINGVSVIADYFVIASATNISQLHALVDSVEEKLFKAGYECKQKEGNLTSTWMLMDYNDVIVPDMAALRSEADVLEQLTDKSYWPYPTYSDLLFY